MASDLSLIEYMCEQLDGIGEVRFRKMFGDYMIYLNDRPIFTVCDNNAYVKIDASVAAILGDDAPKGFPYEGAKERYIVEDLDNREVLQELALALEKITPKPKKKR